MDVGVFLVGVVLDIVFEGICVGDIEDVIVVGVFVEGIVVDVVRGLFGG